MTFRSKFFTVMLFIIVLVLSCGLQRINAAQPLAKITVEAGNHTRIDTPVRVSLKDVSQRIISYGISSALRLEELKGAIRIPVAMQMEQQSEGPVLWWILSGTTPAGGSRSYELIQGQPAKSSVVEVVKDDKALLLKKGDEKILQYNHATAPLPKGKSKLYERSGFIHPLWSPSQMVLTNINPRDHYHHMGIWMPWTHTKFEGKQVDFWNIGEGQGTVRFVKFLSTVSGSVYAGFQAEQEHVALQTRDGEKVVLREVWDVRVYNVGGPEKGYRIVDFVSTQKNVAKTPLYQDKYRYGGFGFRGAVEWDEKTASYLTSEGKNRKNGHATRARWCDTSGSINGQWAGVIHMSHPKNFRHPESMRIWPSGQMFFNWAPSQLGEWVMEPGKSYVFRYRMYVHEGKVDVSVAERAWNDFGNQPVVRLEK
jgi:methane monooxygenase PmoA-like